LIAVFKDAGLSLATVQRARVDHHQISTLFWVNVGVSAALAVGVASLAPVLAAFYSDPRLVWITVAVAGTFLLGGLSVQHLALLQRQMRFTAIAVIELISMSLAVVSAIVLASFFAAGYWALVALHIVLVSTHLVLIWVVCDWRPGRPRRGSGARAMLAFGGNATAASVLNYAGANLDKVLIGWALGPAMLGLYDQAYKLLKLPLNQFSAPVSAVAIPVLSRAIADGERYRRGFLTMLQRMMLLLGPPIAFAVVCADWLIVLALGSQWAAAAMIFGILGVASLLLPVWNAIGWLFVTQNRMQEHLYFHMVDAPLKVLAVVVGLNWGVVGVSIGVVARYYAVAPFLFWLIGRRGPLSASDLYRGLALPFTVIAAIFGLLAVLRRTLLTNVAPLAGLAVCALASLAVALYFMLGSRAGRGVVAGVVQDIGIMIASPGRK
jgi:O-antigen/teichoic acid export membrane protein